MDPMLIQALLDRHNMAAKSGTQERLPVRESTDKCFKTRMSILEKPEVMTKFIKGILLSLLSEAMDQLQILKDINQVNQDDSKKSNYVTFQSIEERYMGTENHADFRIASENNNFDKLARDTDILLKILQNTCREVHYHGTFDVLKKSINALNEMYEEEVKLLRDEQEGEQIIEDLKTQCETERIENIKTMEETNAKIQKLRFEVEDIIIYGQHEVEYYNKWESARNEQNDMKCKEKENYFQNTIDSMKTNMDWENRCHSELMTYLTETRDDFLEEIQYWMKRYDEDMETKESELIKLKADLEKLVEDHEHLQEEFDRRQAAIEDFLEYKRVQFENKVETIRRKHAARVIQAWWRMVMIKKKLGPYSKKTKKKKDGKDKKGKKK